MPAIIPLQPVPNQTVAVGLNGQNCQINAYAKSTGFYLDLYVGAQLIVAGVLCRNNTKIVRTAYLGFVGDLAFVDTQAPSSGGQDPEYSGVGSRWLLTYYTPAELVGAV